MSDRGAHRRSDRTPAVLSKKQREMLLDGYDADNDRHRSLMSRMRDRLRSSVLDFSLIIERLEVAEISKTFAQTEYEGRAGGRPPYPNGLINTLAFVYLAQDNRPVGDNDEGWMFETFARTGVGKALRKRGLADNDVSLTLDVDGGPPFAEIHENLSDVSNEELAQMVQDGELDSGLYARLMIERQSETDDSDDQADR